MSDKPQAVIDGSEVQTLSRSEKRKKNRLENKGYRKNDPSGELQEGFFKRVIRFFIEAKEELTKVVWPTRKETIDTTWRLLVLVILAGLYLGLVDGILTRLLGLIV